MKTSLELQEVEAARFISTIDKIQKELDLSTLAIVKKYFASALVGGDLIKKGHNERYWKVMRKREPGIFDEIIDIRFDKSSEDTNSIHLNFYTTNRKDGFEIRRLITLGELAKIILEDGSKIADEFNSISKYYVDRLSEYRSLLKDTNTTITLLRRQNFLEKLESRKGINFEAEVQDLPELVKGRKTFSYITRIRATQFSPTKKTASIELYYKEYDHRANELKEKAIHIHRVNIEKILKFASHKTLVK